MGSIDKWVQETYAPVVLTCTTPEVERLAQKNNLAFADLLNGFGFIKNADTPLRSVTHSTTLTDFNVRFLAASQFAPLPLQDSMHLLNEVVMRNPPSSLSASSTGMNGAPPPGTGVIDLDIPTIQNVDDVSVFLRVIGAANNTEPLPWYREFKRTLMDTFRCEEYSMMSQPAAMLLVVSSTESNPRASFEYLGAQQNLPSVFAQGLYDSNLPKFYLVVHDVVETEGTSIDPEAILRNLQVPPHAGAVLYFNSLAVDAPTAANVQLWTRHPFVRSPLFPDVNNGNYPYLSEHYGAFQSSEDLGRLDAFVRDFGLRFVLPTLESRIFQLNEVVSAKKKGVKNVFKSWLRKPIDLSARNQPNNNSSVTYRADSIQAQIRLLADTSFLVRDYELALEMYRLVRDDYKSDTSLLHCANTNEMIALCLLLTKGSPVQMTNALEAATATYDKTMNPTTCRLAVRAAVIAGEIYVTLSHSGLFTDYMDNASAALIRGSTKEQGICSAVLMERAAMCDLQARLPKFRKFGFRMVIAGHVYDSSGHSAHSARCYSLTRAVYDCSGWFHVEDHINFTLAQQSNRLNDPMASINLFLKLIGTGRSSASQQENLLSQFRSIVKEFLLSGGVSGGPLSRSSLVSVKQVGASTKKLVIRDLCMPELDDKSTVVFAPVNATGINRDIDGNEAEREVWKELEKLLENQLVIHRQATTPGALSAPKEGQIAESNRWLAPIQAFNLPYRGKRGVANLKPRQYAIGEKIYVEFEMKNALSCAVEVENIHLFGKFEVKGGATFDVPASDSFETNQDERIAVDSVSLQLLPVSEERVRLAVCPKVPGILRITGVRWSICGGDVLGEHAFNIPGLLLQDTRANKEARARAPNVTLIADVVGHMPWLGVTIEPANPSSETFMGEIVRFNVSLSNAGSANLGHLQLCCSDLLLCVSTGEPSGDGPPTYANYIGASGQVVDLSRVTLRPGERRNITVWAKANQAGKLQPHILFKYKRLVEGEDPERALARTVKAKVDLNVLPCVDVSYSIEPSYSSSGEYILALTVTNRKPRRQQIEDPLFSPSATIQLENLVSISESWTILPFTSTSTKSPSVRTAELLDAQETSTLYFRLRRRDRSVGEGMSTVSLSASSKEVSTHLPLHQMLCLDHALEMVRTSSAASNVGAGERPAGGGGIRSIQSVRRENKAQKSGADQAGQPQEDKLDPQPTTKDALLHSVDVDAHLILVWSSPKPSSSAVVVGQTNLTSVKVRAPLKSSTCPLTVTLQYADTVTLQSTPHAALSFAEVEVVMIVRNDSSLSSTPVDFTLELLHPEESKPISTSGAGKPLGPPLASNALLAPAPHFFWSGLTKKRVANFAPNASVAFTLKACFMTAGVYDLNRFRFAVSPSSLDDDESSSSMAPGVFMFPVEYLVYVQRSQDGHGQALHTATVPSLLEA